MNNVAINTPRSPIQLNAYRIPVILFEDDFAGYSNCDAEYTADGKVVSGLSHVGIFKDANMIALYKADDPEFVTVLTNAPSERMVRIAAEVIAESGA